MGYIADIETLLTRFTRFTRNMTNDLIMIKKDKIHTLM